MQFKPVYFLLTVLLFCLELVIALFIKDDFIRPYLGDLLVIILIYCFLRSFFKIPVLQTVLMVLAFSFLMEILQYLNLIVFLDLEHSTVAKMILGNSFSWEDLLMYLAGGVIILLIEGFRGRSIMKSTSS